MLIGYRDFHAISLARFGLERQTIAGASANIKTIAGTA
jgi:hypothetical protein